MWKKVEKKISRHNLLYKLGVYSYKESTNSFADLVSTIFSLCSGVLDTTKIKMYCVMVIIVAT